jgi:hypothetical protein
MHKAHRDPAHWGARTVPATAASGAEHPATWDQKGLGKKGELTLSPMLVSDEDRPLPRPPAVRGEPETPRDRRLRAADATGLVIRRRPPIRRVDPPVRTRRRKHGDLHGGSCARPPGASTQRPPGRPTQAEPEAQPKAAPAAGLQRKTNISRRARASSARAARGCRAHRQLTAPSSQTTGQHRALGNPGVCTAPDAQTSGAGATLGAAGGPPRPLQGAPTGRSGSMLLASDCRFGPAAPRHRARCPALPRRPSRRISAAAGRARAAGCRRPAPGRR